MRCLYPDIRPYHTEKLAVGQGHSLYLELSGSAQGIPVLVLHGGPGAGCSPQMRRFFDPERYHIILFDQRGCGRSEPHAETQHNSVNHILDDIEQIRQHLKIDRWVLFGGSFGATLALLYAQQHRRHTAALILRGVFLGRQQDLDWLYGDGARRFFPEEWQLFCAAVKNSSADGLLQRYHEVLHSSNELARVSAAKAWARWEVANASLRPNLQLSSLDMPTPMALSLARISSHYFIHRCFLTPNQILDEVEKLAEIPAYLIHGRYDMVCPPEQAIELAKLWSTAELEIVRQGGHSAFDPAMTDALVRASAKLAKSLGRPEPLA